MRDGYCPTRFADPEGRCYCVANNAAKEKVMRLLLAAGARDESALETIDTLSLDTALQGSSVRENQKHGAADALRRGWSNAKLCEMQRVFRETCVI